MLTKRVFGNDGSLMVASRPGGYHSFPHRHDSEQLNYCMDGEIWIFVENKAHLLKKGDFSRVPSGKVHWAWNRSDQEVTLVESHVPAMSFPDDPERNGKLLGLFDEGEEPQISGKCWNMYEESYRDLQKEVEERIFSEAVSA
jgi:quercetin dioxygenase-like cupin family protein